MMINEDESMIITLNEPVYGIVFENENDGVCKIDNTKIEDLEIVNICKFTHARIYPDQHVVEEYGFVFYGISETTYEWFPCNAILLFNSYDKCIQASKYLKDLGVEIWDNERNSAKNLDLLTDISIDKLKGMINHE